MLVFSASMAPELWTAKGTVVRGKGEARTLGFPTANIAYECPMVPRKGVWFCEVDAVGRKFDGLAVVGMWNLPSDLPSVEVHLLDMSEDLYGQTLSVHFRAFCRELEKFPTVDALIEQIHADVVAARTYFSQ